jgi:hypothetical protein
MVAAKRRIALPPALALAAVAYMAAVQLAGATHPRPTGATPMRFSLVPAYNQCTAPNRTHGPPLAFGSCSPAVPSSNFVTIGTQSVGSIRLDVHVGAPGPPDDTDVIIKPSISDVRCKGATTSCGNANAAGGPDYTGELQGNATVRITDHHNAVTAGGGTDPATVVDIPFPINMSCTGTADTSVGSLCKEPGATCLGCFPSYEGKRTIAELTQIKVYDAGPDGIVASADGSTLFAVQGLFVP